MISQQTTSLWRRTDFTPTDFAFNSFLVSTTYTHEYTHAAKNGYICTTGFAHLHCNLKVYVHTLAAVIVCVRMYIRTYFFPAFTCTYLMPSVSLLCFCILEYNIVLCLPSHKTPHPPPSLASLRKHPSMWKKTWVWPKDMVSAMAQS